MKFEELLKASRESRKMFGGTFEIHYTDPKCGKMVAFVEACSETKSGVRKAAIKKAVEEQFIPEEAITMVKRFD
jgi:hypothetical protein